MAVNALPGNIQKWFDALRHVKSGSVETWVNDSWDLLFGFPAPAAWSPEETELVINLIRPDHDELAQFVEEHDFELEDGTHGSASSGVWRALANGSRPIVPSGMVAAADEWFSITMTLDHWYPTSTMWSWVAIPLSRDLALLCERSDNYGLPLFPHPFGLITYRDRFASAALLMNAMDYKDEERFCEERLFDELRSSNIPDEEVYRILLARAGKGGREIVHLPSEQLRQFQSPSMRHGFSSVVSVLDASDEEQSRSDSPRRRGLA